MADVIGVESLTKRYGDLVAVDDISFSVRRGEVFGILGPNGAGKTTTLECIEGLLTPTAGSISVLGMDIADDAERIKRRIGVQLQASAYFDYLTLREILDLFALIYRSSASPDGLLAAVGLEDKADTTVAKLSGGQQQRFTIAATLVNDPELIFLDEPTAGLDPNARRDLWEFVQTANRQGRTIVHHDSLHGGSRVPVRPGSHHGSGQNRCLGNSNRSHSFAAHPVQDKCRIG